MSKMKNIIAFFITFVLLLIPIIFSQTTERTPTEEYITYDEFQQDPSLENYQQLSSEDQALYYSDLNNVGQYSEIDAYYFSDPANIGQNPDADKQFFTGAYSDDPATASRDSFQNYPDSASTYVETTYSLSYEVSFSEALAADFLYDAAKGALTNNGKTITLSQFSADEEIQEIKTTPNGFAIIRKKAEIAIAGDATSNVAYDAETNEFIMQDETGAILQTFSIQAGEEVNLEIDKDGSLTIEGKVSGNAQIGNHIVIFNNHVGTLALKANGDIAADNAEVITPFLYADGDFKKQGNTITAQDHGNTKEAYGNIHDSRTIIVDRTTKVGIQTQGQTGADTVTIHADQLLNKFPDFSKFKEAPAPSEMSVEEARTEARQVQPASYDMGGSAEVWIAREPETDEVLVTAKGKVDVGVYKVDDVGASARLQSEPHFIGKNGIAEFELRTGGQMTDIHVRGAAEYTDGQYSNIATDQNGATLRIERSVASADDAIVFDCFECDPGQAIQIDKAITIAKQVVEGFDLYQHVSTEALSFSVNVEEDGTLRYQPQPTQLGSIAAQTEGATVVSGRGIVMKTYCAQDTECNFAINKDREGALQLVSETVDISDPENPLIADILLIDLGVHGHTGEKIVIASEEEIDTAKYVLEQIDQGNIRALAEWGVTIENTEIRDLILRETTIDVSQLDNPTYMQQLEEAASETRQFNDYTQQLFNDYGIEIDSRGNCISDKQTCEKINTAFEKQYNLAWVWSRAKMQALEAENAMIKAQAEAGLVSETEAAEAVRNNKKEISSLERAREQMNVVVTEKLQKEAVKSGFISVQAKQDLNRAAGVAEDVKQLKQRNQQLDESIAYFQDEIDSVWISDATKEQYKAEVQLLEQEKQANEQRIAEKKDAVTTLAAQYAQERPDIAAQICIAEGTHCAGQYIEKTATLDTDTAYALAVTVALNEGDVGTAAQMQQQIADPVLAQQVDQEIYDQVMQDLEIKKQESESLVTEKRKEIMEEYSGVSGFFTYVGRAGSAINLYQLAPGEQESVLEAYESSDAIALKQLEKQRDGALIVTQLMRSYKEQGYTAAEAFAKIEEGVSPTGKALTPELLGDRYEALVYATSTEGYKWLEKGVNGQELSTEESAKIEREKIQTEITFYEGKVAPVRDKIEVFHENFLDTSEATWSQEQIDYLADTCGIYFSCGTVETYGDIAVEAVSVLDVIPAGAILAGVQTAGTAAKAVGATGKMAAAASKGLKVVEAGIGEERIAAAVQKMQPVAEVLTKERYLSSTGRSLQSGVEAAKVELKAAEATGDAAKITEASQKFSDAETAFQGWKTASSTYTNVFLREIGVTSASRAALSELNDAVVVYEKVAKASGASSAIAVEKAVQVVSASKKVQETTLTATITQKVESLFSATSEEGKTVSRSIDVIEDSEAVLVLDDEGRIVADVRDLSEAKQAEVTAAIEDMNTVLIERGVSPKKIVDDAETTIARVVAKADEITVTDRITLELRAQAAGEGSDLLPTVHSDSYAEEITEPVIRTKADVNTQYETAEQMPSQDYMENFVAAQRAEEPQIEITVEKVPEEIIEAVIEEEQATGRAITEFLDDPVLLDETAGRETAGPKTLDELLAERKIVLEAGDVKVVRTIDYQILARADEPPISGWTDDMFDEDIAAAMRSDGTLQKTTEATSLEGTFDEAVSGVKTTVADESLDDVISRLEADPWLYRVYDEAGNVNWKETEALHQAGIRHFKTEAGTRVPIRVDEVVETFFDWCRQRGMKCGLAGSDAYRSIRLRKPTNIEKSSDFDIIRPSDEELERVYPGRSWEWENDLIDQFSAKVPSITDPITGIVGIGIDVIGWNGKLRPEIDMIPGETSRKLILQSDGTIFGSEDAVIDALTGTIRLDKEPNEIRQVLRAVRFATEEEGVSISSGTKEMLKEYVKRLFVDGTEKVTTPSGNRVTKKELIEGFLSDEEADDLLFRSLYTSAYYGDLAKHTVKVFENSLDARKSVELMDDLGLKKELVKRGLDLDGLGNLVEQARTSGTKVSHDELEEIIQARVHVGDTPYTMTDEKRYLQGLMGQPVSDEVVQEVLGPFDSDYYNGLSVSSKIFKHKRYKQIAEEMTTPLGELEITPDTIIESTLSRHNILDDEGNIRPEYANTKFIDILEARTETAAAAK